MCVCVFDLRLEFTRARDMASAAEFQKNGSPVAIMPIMYLSVGLALGQNCKIQFVSSWSCLASQAYQKSAMTSAGGVWRECVLHLQ